MLAGPCSTVPPAPIPDITRARADLGFSVDVSLDEGLRRCAEVYRTPVGRAVLAKPMVEDLASDR